LSREDDPYDLDAGTEEHYADAVLYDFEYRRRRADVNHYRRLAKELGGDGPIVELGCGTGRLMIPLLRDGHRLIGLDRSQSMLRRAAEKSARRSRRPLLLRADMRRFGLGVRVPLVLAAFNTFQHLYTWEDFLGCLTSVRECLAPGGKLAFDVLSPDLTWLVRDPRKRWARTLFTHPETGEKLEYTTNHSYDPSRQIAYVRIYYRHVDGDRTRVVRLAHRQFFPEELLALLHAAGYRVERRWGGFNEEVFDGGSDTQVVVCSPVEK